MNRSLGGWVESVFTSPLHLVGFRVVLPVEAVKAKWSVRQGRTEETRAPS